MRDNRQLVFPRRFIEELSGDALKLWGLLQAEHGLFEEFSLPNAYKDSLGWGLKRFRAAKEQAENAGAIVCLHKGGAGPNDPPIYKLSI